MNTPCLLFYHYFCLVCGSLAVPGFSAQAAKVWKGEAGVRGWESNMVKLWFVCNSFYNFIEYVFFVVCNG